MQAKEFVNKLYDACVDADVKEFEIVYSRGASGRIDAYEGKISDRSNNESQYVYLKVKNGKNIGGFACEELQEKNIPLMVSQAVENAKLIDADDENFFHDGSGDYKKVNKYQPIAELFEKLSKEQFLIEVEKAAYALDKRVKKVISLYMVTKEGDLIVKNSLGLDLSDSSKVSYAVLYLSAEQNGIIKTGDEFVLFDTKEDFEPETLAKEAVKRAVAKLEAKELNSGKTRVVFENKTFAQFLGVISNIFSANVVQEKRSKLIGKLGKKIANDIVTLIDDPFWSGGYNTRSFDEEGYPAQLNVVIKDGILKTYLHNLRTAHKDGVKPTGNGSGGRGISFANFYLQKGEISKDELLSKVGEGVYITDMSGMHAGYNSVSGDFSFGAQGFMIENGVIGSALDQFTVSGNVYQMLEDIEMLGADLKFNSSGFGSPTVAIKNLAVSNK